MQLLEGADAMRSTARVWPCERIDADGGFRDHQIIAVGRLAQQPAPGIYYLADPSTGSMILGNVTDLPADLLGRPRHLISRQLRAAQARRCRRERPRAPGPRAGALGKARGGF
jgi:hypothetical protein